MSAETIEHRLSWESPSPWECDGYERQFGKDVWQKMPWEMLDLTWTTTSVTFLGDERMDQFATLSEWAATSCQPIRNVRLERRVVPDPDSGWEDVV